VFVIVIAVVFGGTTYAAARMMDDSASIDELRAQRAKAEAAHRKKAAKRKRGRRVAGKKPIAAAPVPAAAPARKRQRWAARANDVCDGAYDEALFLAEETAAETTPAAILRLFKDALALQGRLIVRLQRLGPAPNGVLYERLMSELVAGQVEDARFIRSLERQLSPETLTRMLRDSKRRNVTLRRLFDQLGARSCSRLYAPIA
jgi:hypothetical protein